MHPSRSIILTILILGLALLVGLGRLSPVRAAATTYYIAPTGNDTNPGTEAQPWLTLQKATTTLMPGDTVLVKNGTYEKAVSSGAAIVMSRSGTPDAWITYKAYPGQRPKIVSRSWNAVRFSNVAYIEFNGFEVQGIPDPMSSYAGDGIGIHDTAHHIRIVNNDVYGFGGGGINTVGGDYIDIEGNRVHGTSKLSPYATSAISLFKLYNFDNAEGYHNVIRGNIVYDNENTVPQQRTTGPVITDGNCIIIDHSRHTLNGVAVNPYTGYTLIENNMCFNNGGRGVHVYESDNVFAINNTLYMDQRSSDINDGELGAYNSGNVQFFNNIVYTLPNKQANQIRVSSNTVFSRNLYFNTTNIPVKSSDDLIGVDPSFMNGTIDPQSADFRLQQISPAIDTALTSYFPLIDLLGNIRPFGSMPDLGAYEFVSSAPPVPTVPPLPLPTTTPPLPSGPVLYLDVQPANAAVGQTVKANLQLKSMSNLFGLDLKCAVNAAVLTGGTRSDGTVFSKANSFFVDGGFKADGSWALGASLLNPAPAFSGDGVALTLSYQVKSVGNSTVTCAGLAVDRNGRSLSMTVINGAFNNAAQTQMMAMASSNVVVAAEPTLEPLSMIPTLPVVEVPLIPETPTPLPQQALALPTVPPLIGSVSGITSYQNRSSQMGIIVQLFSGQTALAQLVTNADGGFQFTDVPDGSYTLELSAPGHLPVVTSLNVVGGQPVSLGTLALLSGDADNNGSIDLSDAALIGANFQLAVPPAPASADLNGDGQINIADLALVGSNYGSISPLTQP